MNVMNKTAKTTRVTTTRLLLQACVVPPHYNSLSQSDAREDDTSVIPEELTAGRRY